MDEISSPNSRIKTEGNSSPLEEDHDLLQSSQDSIEGEGIINRIAALLGGYSNSTLTDAIINIAQNEGVDPLVLESLLRLDKRERKVKEGRMQKWDRILLTFLIFLQPILSVFF